MLDDVLWLKRTIGFLYKVSAGFMMLIQAVLVMMLSGAWVMAHTYVC